MDENGINFRFLDDDELLETPTGAFVLEDYLFGYRGGDSPQNPSQLPMPVESDDVTTFSTYIVQVPNSNALHEVQCGLLKAEEQFQAEVESDPVLAGLQLMQPQKHDVNPQEDDYRGTSGTTGEVHRPADDPDMPSSFVGYQPFKPSRHSPSPEPRTLPAPDDTDISQLERQTFSRQDIHVRPYSQFTAPGRFDGTSNPIDPCVVPPRPASMESNLSAMAVDDQTVATRYPFTARSSVGMDQSSAEIGDQRFVSAIQQQSRDEEVHTACLAVMRNAPVSQQPQGPSQQIQFGSHPCLKVINQPQHEQTVLYQSDSANRGVLKDREGKGFPSVMVCDYQGPAEISVYAATSTGQPHPFFFVQCVENVGQCNQRQDETGLLFVRTSVDSKNGMRAIFPKLSVKRYKEKEVKQNFAQWQEERGTVYLRFIARLAHGHVLDVMSEQITMTKKAEMQKRRELVKVQPSSEPTPAGAMAVQPSVAHPVIRRVIGKRGSHDGGEEICLYGNNFSADCFVVFSFPGVLQQPIQANKCTEQMACTNTHLLIQVPPSPLSAYPTSRRQQQLLARIYVINPSTCAQNVDSDSNAFIYCD